MDTNDEKEQELLAIAEKIKNGTATNEEAVQFFQEFDVLLGSLKEDLGKLQA